MRKVRKGVDIIDKEFLILVSLFWAVLQNTSSTQQSFPCSHQNINPFHSTWCILVFNFLCFHFPCYWQKGGGSEAQRNSFSALLFYFFPSRMYYHVLFHIGFCSAVV